MTSQTWTNGGTMMKIDKCKNCKHYNSFFNSCGLYYQDVYLGEGDFEIHPVSIKNVSKLECEYEANQ